MRHLLLVDGDNLVWRAFHATRTATASGVPWLVLTRFLAMVRTAVWAHHSRSCCVVWDGGVPAFRVDRLAQYKQHRRHAAPGQEPPPEIVECYAQRRALGEVLPLLGVHATAAVGWEADDVLAYITLTRALSIVVLSNDHDLWQLVSERVCVRLPGQQVHGDDARLITPALLRVEYGCTEPRAWLWFRALMGDAGDNIPGVGKIGEVKARQRVEQCNNDLMQIVATLTPEQREAFARNLEVMDLHSSVQRFSAARPPMTVTPAARDLDAARAWFAAQGVHDVEASGWLRWSRPFGGLDT